MEQVAGSILPWGTHYPWRGYWNQASTSLIFEEIIGFAAFLPTQAIHPPHIQLLSHFSLNRKVGLRVICLRAHGKLMAKWGLEPRCWGPDLANLPMALGDTGSQDKGRSRDQTASNSGDKKLAQFGAWGHTRTVSQWMKTVSGHSTQEIRPFLFIVFCIDENFCAKKFHIHNQTK